VRGACALGRVLIIYVFFLLYIFWRARVCWPFCTFERCLDSNPESCRCKLARYQLSHPSP
jgi:hypothetical protein